MGFYTSHLKPALTPWLTSGLELYNEAIGKMFDPLATILEDSAVDPSEWTGAPFTSAEEEQACIPDPGWGSILNPRTFPSQYNPQYLGQYVGVQGPEGLTNAEDLVLIAEEQGFSRGTAGSILLAAKRGLKPGAAITLLERTNTNYTEDPYYFLLSVKGESFVGSVVTTGNVESGKATIKSTETAGMEVGESVVALGFKPEAKIKQILSNTELELTETSTVTATGVKVVAVSSSGVTTVKNNVNYVKPAGLLWALVTAGTYAEYEAFKTTYALNEAAHATYALTELEPGS